MEFFISPRPHHIITLLCSLYPQVQRRRRDGRHCVERIKIIYETAISSGHDFIKENSETTGHYILYSAVWWLERSAKVLHFTMTTTPLLVGDDNGTGKERLDVRAKW